MSLTAMFLSRYPCLRFTPRGEFADNLVSLSQVDASLADIQVEGNNVDEA
jgi:hypothetical protein